MSDDKKALVQKATKERKASVPTAMDESRLAECLRLRDGKPWTLYRFALSFNPSVTTMQRSLGVSARTTVTAEMCRTILNVWGIPHGAKRPRLLDQVWPRHAATAGTARFSDTKYVLCQRIQRWALFLMSVNNLDRDDSAQHIRVATSVTWSTYFGSLQERYETKEVQSPEEFLLERNTTLFRQIVLYGVPQVYRRLCEERVALHTCGLAATDALCETLEELDTALWMPAVTAHAEYKTTNDAAEARQVATWFLGLEPASRLPILKAWEAAFPVSSGGAFLDVRAFSAADEDALWGGSERHTVAQVRDILRQARETQSSEIPYPFLVDRTGRVLQRYAPKNSPLAGCIDHWYPYVYGGPTTRANAHLLHHACNTSKSARLPFFVDWDGYTRVPSVLDGDKRIWFTWQEILGGLDPADSKHV